MSEATRLEQMLASTEKINFDLKTVIQGCIAGYQQVYDQVTFNLNTNLDTLAFNGSPEHIVQLLDKVISNAVEFSQDNLVTVELIQHNENAQILIHNNGALLPDKLSESLFDSMVSLRSHYSGDKQDVPHLGLGLYIARLICQFHQGEITAQNHHSPDGVTIKITLPIKH